MFPRSDAGSDRERERENLFDIALRTDTIIRLIIQKKHLQEKPGSIKEPFGYRVEMLPDFSRLQYKRNPVSDTVII